MSKEKGEAKGGKTLLIVAIVLLVVVVVGMGSFVTVMLLGNKSSSKTSKTTAVSNKSAYTYSLGDFVVNLGDTDQKRYLKVTIQVGYDSTKMAAELKTTDPTLKDSIISVLRSKKSSDLNTKAGTDQLKKQLIDSMNPFLTTGKISYVYFTDFLIE